MADPEGLQAYQVDPKGNLFPVQLTLDKDYFTLRIHRVTNNVPQAQSLETIPFQEIKQIYPVEFEESKSSVVHINSQFLKELRSSNARKKQAFKFKLFRIAFGRQFNLKRNNFLVVEHETPNRTQSGSVETWIFDTNNYLHSISSPPYFKMLEIWYRKQFDTTTSTCTDNFRLTLWKQFLHRCHVSISPENLANLIPTQYIGRGLGTIEKEEFDLMAKHLMHSHKSIQAIFEPSGRVRASNPETVESGSLSQHQHDTLSIYFEYLKVYGDDLPNILIDDTLDELSPLKEAMIRKTAEDYSDGTRLSIIEDHWLSSHFILDFLFSDQNSIWDPAYLKVYQDMDRPLSHYYINSSHNTYLTGNQYSSQSSVEAYARVLRQGCRCIEIDVWNGHGQWNKPIVTHGRTLTTSVRLKDVLLTIKEHAFVASTYPLIISIENHCNVKQQKVMAKYFHRIFGKALVTGYLDSSSTLEEMITSLPSPSKLQNRIILKGKKLPTHHLHSSLPSYSRSCPSPTSPLSPMQLSPTFSTCSNDVFSDEPHPKMDNIEESSCECLNTGELWKTNDQSGEWIRCIFVLTKKQLFYVENGDGGGGSSGGDEDEGRQPPAGGYLRRNPFRYSISSVMSNQELHTDQLWYHGKVFGGRSEAATTLREDSRVDGTFLVRDSDTDHGGFSLSFFANEKVFHCQIHSRRMDQGEKVYSLKKEPNENEVFTSIYELIEHYQQNEIVIEKEDKPEETQRVLLVEPVPLPKTHEDKEWFYKDMDRATAESILERLPINGAFIARYRTENKNEIVISFRFDNVIKHCHIKREGRYLTVANFKFPKLENLKEHYEKYNFYRNIKLAYPVGSQMYQQSQQSDCVQQVYRCQEYIGSTVKTIKGRVRAIQSYRSYDPELLSFEKGDIIINVVKEPDGWWWGTLNVFDSPKQFCSSFVEEIEELDCPFDDACKGTFKISVGLKVKVKCCTDKKGKEMGIKYYLKFKDLGTKRQLGASCSKRKVNEWADMITDVVNKDKEGEIKLAKMQASVKHNIAPEYSDLIVYCCALDQLNPDDIGLNSDNINVTAVKSLDELAGEKLFRSRPSYFVWYHQYAMTRIYPNGFRFDSSNFRPARLWNYGSQMVALNWQMPDKPMQWNRGKFRQNGNCGYVLKPDFMISETQTGLKLQFDPTQLTSGEPGNGKYLHIQIISARHLEKQRSGPLSPLVEIEVIGVDADCRKLKTNTILDNGLNPFWNFTTELPLICPELALVQFSVCHEDSYNDKLLLGEATIPVSCMRQGFRSIQLMNGYGEPLLSSLLVRVTKENF